MTASLFEPPGGRASVRAYVLLPRGVRFVFAKEDGRGLAMTNPDAADQQLIALVAVHGGRLAAHPALLTREGLLFATDLVYVAWPGKLEPDPGDPRWLATARVVADYDAHDQDDPTSPVVSARVRIAAELMRRFTHVVVGGMPQTHRDALLAADGDMVRWFGMEVARPASSLSPSGRLRAGDPRGVRVLPLAVASS